MKPDTEKVFREAADRTLDAIDEYELGLMRAIPSDVLEESVLCHGSARELETQVLPVVDLLGLCFEDQVFEYNLHAQVLPEISPVTIRVQFRCRKYVPAAVRWLQMGSIGPQFYLAA